MPRKKPPKETNTSNPVTEIDTNSIETMTDKIRTADPKLGVITVNVKGITPLVCHAKSEKMKKTFGQKYGTKSEETEREKQTKMRKGNEDETPHEQFRNAIYYMPGTRDTDQEEYGIPASGFLGAMCSIASEYFHKDKKLGINATSFRKAVQVYDDSGGFVRLDTETPEMRTDWVLINKKVPQLRFRPEFKEWSCQLRIQYDMETYRAAEILHILKSAGLKLGWGEMRPEKGAGTCGMWALEGSAKIVQISGEPV